MTKVKTFIAAAAAVMILGLAACSNVEDGFHVADRSNLKLSISPQSTQSGGTSASTQNLSIINAVNGSDKVYVDCPAIWKVEVLPNSKPEAHSEWTLYIGEIGKDEKGNYFTYTSSINAKEERYWENAIKVFVEGLDGEELVPQYLTVRQGANVLVPNPTSFEIFPASGKGGTINVKASDNSWSVESDVEYMSAFPTGWITIDRSKKDDGTISFDVHANRGTSVRSGNIRFLDGSGKEVAVIDISQLGSNHTFDAYLNSVGLISCDGASLTLNVLTDKRWKVECAEASAEGWLTIEGLGQNQLPTVGTEGGAGKQISVVVAPNGNQGNRTAKITLSSTEDEVTAIHIPIIQAGTQQPALTTPWLEGICDQKKVDIFARFYSDTEILDSGIEIRYVRGDYASEDAGFVRVSNRNENSGNDGIIYVQLSKDEDYSGLEYRAGTNYEIRSYIVTSGSTIYSTVVEFTVPGVKPGNGDQGNPDIK
ncbi:MAG: hypothetical protein K2N35_04915 [Muribaculaceae bacterium]|nr:hypothetical protein [Muribaculaceae bacterium]